MSISARVVSALANGVATMVWVEDRAENHAFDCAQQPRRFFSGDTEVTLND